MALFLSSRFLPASYRETLAHRGFAAYWSGFSLSLLGDAMTRVALLWHVYALTDSAAAVAALAFWFTAPVVVGGLLAGWLLDRFDRRRVLMLDSLFRAGVVGSVPVLAWAGALAPWHLYVVAGVHGFLMMIPLAGTPALLPSLVPDDRLHTANAMETLSYTLSGIVGPPVAGWIVAADGAPAVLALDALTYVAFAWFLGRVPAEQAPDDAAAGGTAYRLADAFALLFRSRVLSWTTAMFMAVNVMTGALIVCLPIYVDRILHGGAGLYGTLLCAMALGEIVTAGLAGAIRLPLTLGTLICLFQFGGGLAVATLAMEAGLAAALAGLFLLGAMHAPLTIWAQTLRMRIIPVGLRGRTFALLRMLMQGAGPLGSLAGGAALPALGMPAVLALAAAAGGVPGLLGLRSRDLREAN